MIEIGNITLNEKLTKDHEIYSMWISAPNIARSVKPGQIVHVKCNGYTLRRPISVCQSRYDKIRLCYEVRGDGTKFMSELKAGDSIDLLGAHGNGFDVSDVSKKILIAGGGLGVYPLLSAAQAYGRNTTAVLGFRNKSFMTLTDDFISCGADVKVATDDGSYGHKGYAIDVVKETLDSKKIDIIMVCGPKIMMKGIALLSEERGIRCQVSMEERMACGVGACLACVCNTRTEDSHSGQKKKRICVDGPVMEGIEVDWDEHESKDCGCGV